MTEQHSDQMTGYGPARESAAEALAWLVDQGDRFGHFIDGAFTAPGNGFMSHNPATGEVLATLTQADAGDVDAAVDAARKAQGKWHRLGGKGRARHLYALARMIQKHARLFAVLEVLDNGKPIREARDIDIPLAQRHFYHHAGLAQLIDSECPGTEPHGVCGQIVPWNFPLLMLAWKLAPALAAGNTVVLKPAEQTSLTALLFTDICRQAGLPKGVVNIVTGDGTVGEMIVTHAGIDKIAFTGSAAVGRRIRELTAGSGKALTLELGGKSPFIVFDDADPDSAVEGVVDAIWVNQGQVCCAGSRLLLQESIADTFLKKLRARMVRLRVGDPLDKNTDIGAMIDLAARDRVAALVEGAGGARFTPDTPLPETGAFCPPTLIAGLSPADPLMQDEIFGPVLVSTTFRTPAEAVALANDTRYGLAASVWSEDISRALVVAPQLAAGVVWVNGTNMLDAAAPFGGLRESGFGREGGWEGLAAYTRPAGKSRPLTRIAPFAGNGDPVAGDIDRTAKLYIGGKQVRPDGGYSRNVYGKTGKLLGQAPMAARKDIRNAVEAARGAGAWGRSTGHQRAQILYYMAENLSARTDGFASLINHMTGTRGGAKEVEAAIDRLFTCAAWADKMDGRSVDTPAPGLTLTLRQPVGVIGALCPDEAPLLGLVSVLGPIMAMGNRAVLIASEPFPLAALEFVQVLETSDVPAGVVNLLSGCHEDLAPTLAGHMDIDAVWSFSSSDLSGAIERDSAASLKRTWVNHGAARDWPGPQGEGRAFLEAATEIKTLWLPAAL
ncbi:aldehyde dehydrogenase family protein [Roseovarius sp. PS-C2]|uniref:aldehyde dehydrogenase family protein n=1 Tax=Roseovarius sp. PS-C2 TaxID=2820814 RepID=UPI001C0B32C7|nr:aldehyde dehydrogenase family protein [Roseovarius sp. PS-C2]MBU3260618.1 aldehyde dehydrogenase family protein [Roseovarius sp. PS-C2]